MPIPAKSKTSKELAKQYGIPVDAVKAMRRLPGYDPFAQARPTDTIDLARAEYVIDLFSEHLHIPDTDKAGQLMPVEPWMESILLNVYAWYQPDGNRRYREIIIYVPKKNSKTTFSAGWAAIEFRYLANPGAQFFSAAANREQAGLVFKVWAGMLSLDEDLREGTTVFGARGPGTVKSIVNESRHSSYKPLSRDADSGDGVGPDFLLIDELHRHPDGELMETLEKSTAAKRNALIIKTTTADYDRPSPCNRMIARARAIRDNDGDPSKPGYAPKTLPVIYEIAPEEYKANNDCWQDLQVWKRANPNWGVTITEEFAIEQIQLAIDDPSTLNNLLRLHLNIVTDQSEIWMPMDKYDVCAPTRDDSELYGMPCYGGMDLSTTQDLTSFCLAWKHPDGGYDMRWWFWIPGDKLMDRIKKDGVPYQVWANDGWLELIPGEVIDQEYVKQRIMEICAQYRVVTIGADKFNNTWIMQELDRNKINVQPFAQNAGTITEPAKELMTRVIEGKFRHGCNPVARWNFSNAVIKKFPNDTFRLDKDKAEKRIDGVAAAIMAVGCSMQDIKVESVYARYGVLSGSG
jgi:phage terminase large subunit-like protein